MPNPRRCPALLVSAPASGQGKTTVTAALARLFRDRGLRVSLFKVGPDFLDPMILERAADTPVYQLDLWLGGERHCRDLLASAAEQSDVILIEGVMGLFDGEPSSADLAALLGVPVLAVIDASSMAQTFAAVAAGLARFRPCLPFAGVFANRIAGEHHAALAAQLLPDDLPLVGWLARDTEATLPDRHLGLVQADELPDLDRRIARAAAAIRWTNGNLPLVPVAFAASPDAPLPRLLEGRRIAVARDAAFSFLYRANLDLLRALGAELHFFSPLTETLPSAEALYLPGGYPELHLTALAENHALRAAIHAHHRAERPIVAECGGMLYLMQSLTDTEGRCAPMAALLPGTAVMQPRLAALGLQRVELPEGELCGHTFHFSRSDVAADPVARGVCPNGGPGAEPVWRMGRLTASYIHFYFPSNPEAAARLFLP
jgi:cobyrinic acid a,c-diamide synthase